MIILERVELSFNKSKPLLCNVDLAVRRGESFVLLGPSGVGKSTLLKTMAGLVTPNAGRVLIDGVDINEASRLQRAQTLGQIGMLFQKNALFDSLKVLENLTFPLRETLEISEKEAVERARYFLEGVELGESADLFPDEISGGMQKRLGIARALVLNPKIILYDDPTAGLDPVTSKIIVELILKLKKEFGTTLVTITNDVNRAYQLADRIGIIQNQTLFITGGIEATRDHKDQTVQSFLQGSSS